MRDRTYRGLAGVALLGGIACTGSEEIDLDQEACEVRGTEAWDLVDAGATADEATPVALNQAYQVNVRQEQPGYLQLDLAAEATIAMYADQEGTLTAVFEGDRALALTDPAANPQCPTGLPEVRATTAGPGDLTLEIGPVFQASVWLWITDGALSEE